MYQIFKKLIFFCCIFLCWCYFKMIVVMSQAGIFAFLKKKGGIIYIIPWPLQLLYRKKKIIILAYLH